ncbi:acyltransferase [Methylobacterium terricola]|uniref:Acyltransferase n=1 Tax=Methylobacterium terricola TaxID=2583531 RepID=A0A5C4LG78_9HYPH|nr:acyltransferase [Methylobacterium terricola]TNC12260.1 acyltransferase [Methylobacterium terricola]
MHHIEPPPKGAVENYNQRQVLGIDGLRFCAAVSVMLFHLGCTSWRVPSSEAMMLLNGRAQFPELLGVASVGWVGVPVFFAISGFVIAYSAEGSSPDRFFRSRFLRLAPGVWICSSVSFLIALAFLPIPAKNIVIEYIKTLVLFPAPQWIDGVYWTLGIEISFYAIIFVLILLRKENKIEDVMTAIGSVSAIIWIMASTPWFPGLDILASKRVSKLLLITHGCDFALGVLIWLMAFKGVTTRRLSVAAICCLGSILQISYDTRFTETELGITSLGHIPIYIFIAFLLLMMLSLSLNQKIHALLGSRGGWALRTLGLTTYPLYLLHTFVGVLAMRAALACGCPPLASLVIGALVAGCAALVVATKVEPMLRQQMGGAFDLVIGKKLRKSS